MAPNLWIQAGPSIGPAHWAGRKSFPPSLAIRDRTTAIAAKGCPRDSASGADRYLRAAKLSRGRTPGRNGSLPRDDRGDSVPSGKPRPLRQPIMVSATDCALPNTFSAHRELTEQLAGARWAEHGSFQAAAAAAPGGSAISCRTRGLRKRAGVSPGDDVSDTAEPGCRESVGHCARAGRRRADRSSECTLEFRRCAKRRTDRGTAGPSRALSARRCAPRSAANSNRPSRAARQ